MNCLKVCWNVFAKCATFLTKGLCVDMFCFGCQTQMFSLHFGNRKLCNKPLVRSGHLRVGSRMPEQKPEERVCFFCFHCSTSQSPILKRKIFLEFGGPLYFLSSKLVWATESTKILFGSLRRCLNGTIVA